MLPKLLVFTSFLFSVESLSTLQLTSFDVITNNLTLFEFSKLQLEDFNETAKVLKGEITISEIIDNNFIIEVKTLKKDDENENDVLLKPPFSVYETPFCDAMAADKYFYPALDVGTDLKMNCPLQKGIYNFPGFVYAPSFPDEVLPSGKYTAIILISGEHWRAELHLKAKFIVKKI